MDISAANWNEDDNANTTAAPDGAPEGMAPSGVNNVLRTHQGALKRFYSWTIPKNTGGSATAYTLSYAVAPGALVDGMTHLVQFHAVNGTSATLNVNNLGAIPLQYYSAGAWRAVPAALWDADVIFRVAYNAAAGAYRILNRPDTTGDWVPTGRSTARAGTILAQGQAVSRTGYAGLFAAYGTTYGAGDGSTTFNLPNLQGRVVAGVGGSYVLGAAIGSDTNTASVTVSGGTSGSLAVNTTSTGMDGPTAVQNISQGGGAGVDAAHIGHTHANVHSIGSTSGSLSVSASGASAAFSVVQPTRVGNYAICL
jgi:microcystin-dependent protein